MAVPDLKGELRLGATWTDITADLYARGGGITHTRGRPYRKNVADAGACTMTIKNKDGTYTPRNPEGPYHGLFGRNTPARISVTGAEPYLSTTDSTASTVGASTPDHTSLDITGDIDVRIEATLENWQAAGSVELCGKGNQTGNQRSWLLLLRDGTLRFEWSLTGSTVANVFSGIVLPTWPGLRMAVRATLDVDNGAGGHTVRLYTAPSITGPWTQITNVTGSGTSTIFNSNAPLMVGNGWADLAFPGPNGRIHALEVRNGIDGTVVANPDFSLQTPGATSFVDGAGRTWTVGASSSITDRVVRFNGEVPEWPPKWATSEADARATVQAAGVLRRLSTGQKPLQSTLRRRIPSGNPLAYWPMEEGTSASQASSPIAGVRPLRVSGLSFASDDSLPGSSPLPTLGQTASLTGRVPGATAGAWHAEMVYKLDQLPATEQTMFTLDLNPGSGGVAQARVRVSTAGIRVQALDDDGAVVAQFLHTDPNAIAAFTGVWNRLAIFSAVSGSDTQIIVGWRDVITGIWWYAATVYTGTPGTVVGVRGSWGADFQGMGIGHLGVFNVGGTTAPSTGVTIYESADDGFSGETAGARMQRLRAEEGVPLTIIGDPDDTQRMGPQRPATLLDLLRECADVDHGFFGERRDQAELVYRTRVHMYNQDAKLVLDYSSGEVAPPFEPVEDDQIRNDWTVQREGGSSGYAVLEEGALSVQAPPDGIGQYEDSVTLPLYSDEQAEQIADWLLHLSTWDEARYPTVTVYLHHRPDLIPNVLDLDVGDKIRITNLPKRFTGSGTVDLLVDGWVENFRPKAWTITFNCAPAGPYTVGVYDDGHRQTDGSELAAAVDSDDTTLTVLTTAGLIWTTQAGDMPIDIEAGGEHMPVSAIASFISDAFGRTSASSWGTADSGQTWQTVGGGSASDYAVGSGYGSHTLSTVDVTRRTAITAAHPDCDFYGSITTSALATGASLFGAITARMLDSGTMYMARLEFTTSNTIVLVLRKLVADVGTDLGTYTVPVTHVAGVFIRVRLQATGSLLRAKAWLASDREPDRWHIAATDTSITAANSLGTRSIRTTGNTNAATVQIRYDDFAVVNPQRFTVARSANSIVKSHAAGTAVRVYLPAVRAL